MTKRGGLRHALRVEPGTRVDLERFDPGETHRHDRTEPMTWRCSTDSGPWYLVPANRKWFRNLAVAEILGDVLEDLQPEYPPADPDVPPGLRVS